MELSQRQQRVGAIWGVIAFLGGAAATWWVVEPNGEATRLNRTLWLYLSAHYRPMGPLPVEAVVQSYPRLALVESGARPKVWYLIPVATSALGAAGANITLGRTHDWQKIAENSALVLLGYLPAALIGVVWSEAAPSLGFFLIIVGGAFLALAVGSRAVGSATQGTPVLGVTSLWGLFGIGLLVLLGGFLVINLLLPIAVFALIGSAVGTGVVFVARTKV